MCAGAELLLGFSTHADGRRSLILTNHEHTRSALLTVHLHVEPAAVREVDPRSGAEAAVVDELGLPGLQLTLDAAQARLLLLPAARL